MWKKYDILLLPYFSPVGSVQPASLFLVQFSVRKKWLLVVNKDGCSVTAGFRRLYIARSLRHGNTNRQNEALSFQREQLLVHSFNHMTNTDRCINHINPGHYSLSFWLNPAQTHCSGLHTDHMLHLFWIYIKSFFPSTADALPRFLKTKLEKKNWSLKTFVVHSVQQLMSLQESRRHKTSGGGVWSQYAAFCLRRKVSCCTAALESSIIISNVKRVHTLFIQKDHWQIFFWTESIVWWL